RIDRDPADAFGEELGAAVLGLADDRSGWAEALVAQRGARDADAVDVACRNAQRSGEADEQAVEIGALPAQVATLEHRLDVARAASAGLRIAQRVLHDPFVDGASLLQVGASAPGNFHERRLAHEAIARDH